MPNTANKPVGRHRTRKPFLATCGVVTLLAALSGFSTDANAQSLSPCDWQFCVLGYMQPPPFYTKGGLTCCEALDEIIPVQVRHPNYDSDQTANARFNTFISPYLEECGYDPSDIPDIYAALAIQNLTANPGCM